MMLPDPQKKIVRAREADLYKFILSEYPNTVSKASNDILVNNCDSSIKIHGGYGGGAYKYSGKQKGEVCNAIDYLMRYLGYQGRFWEAVHALLKYAPAANELDENGKYKYKASNELSDDARFEQKLPQKTSKKYQQVFAYLTTTRRIPADIVTMLFKEKLLYQDINSNCVFKSAHCNFAEIIGTNSFADKQFRGIVGSGYWAFNAKSTNNRIYICMDAIEAIRMYDVVQDDKVTFVSVGGCTKPKPFISIMQDECLGTGETILCFDEHDIGAEAYERIQTIISDTYVSDGNIETPAPSEEDKADVSAGPEEAPSQLLTQEIIDEFVSFYRSGYSDVYDAYKDYVDKKGFLLNFNEYLVLIENAQKTI